MNTSDIRARIVAVLVGVVLLVFGATVPSRLFGNNVLLLFLSDITTYGIAGWIVGFIWPNGGWRLGLYLAAVWPPVLIFGAFLAWEQPTTERANELNLVGYLLIVASACTGSALGALISRRARNKSHPIIAQ